MAIAFSRPNLSVREKKNYFYEYDIHPCQRSKLDELILILQYEGCMQRRWTGGKTAHKEPANLIREIKQKGIEFISQECLEWSYILFHIGANMHTDTGTQIHCLTQPKIFFVSANCGSVKRHVITNRRRCLVVSEFPFIFLPHIRLGDIDLKWFSFSCFVNLSKKKITYRV